MKKAILLLSGGLDSATCGLIARNVGFEIYAMSFFYGQRHDFELNAAKKVASFLDVKEHRIVNIDPTAFGSNALTSSNIDVPKGSNISKDSSDIPITYVPARNTIFLSYALAWAEVLNCTDIFIGVNDVDYSGYPDCRPEYIAAYERMANLATVSGIQGQKLKIHTPLISFSKAEIIKTGLSGGIDYSITHSCYDPDAHGNACGSCDSCQIRKKGFEEAQTADPTVYNS
ncbi:MAG: 7-cyano-7-deazaguanine synthase QueC [Chitinispirillales bacterium]|nr:7-cyano-7-deazaguanine synthase QueC [Chitinispirillales bacterium]